MTINRTINRAPVFVVLSSASIVVAMATTEEDAKKTTLDHNTWRPTLGPHRWCRAELRWEEAEAPLPERTKP